MRRIQSVLALAAVIAASTVLASPAAAVTGTLDQYQNSLGTYPLWGSDYSLAQSFTAGMSGPLTAVGIYAATWGETGTAGSAAKGSATLAIVPTYNGLPNTEFPLVTKDVIVPATDGGEWVYYSFSSPPDVELNGQYAVVVTIHAPWGLEWLGSCPSAYASGQASVKGPSDPYWLTIPQWNTVHHTTNCMGDFSFRTYVGSAATPAPTATHTPVATATHAAVATATTRPGAVPPPPPTPRVSAAVSATATTAAPTPSPATSPVAPPIVADATDVAGAAASPTQSDAGGVVGSSSSSSSDPPIAVLVIAGAGLGAAALLLIWKLGVFAGRT